MRPLVIIIENPDEDPTILTIGNVEVVEISSYPISRYSDVTDLVDAGYEEECTALLSRIIETYRPEQRGEVETHLGWMLSEITRLRKEYGEDDQDPDADPENDLEEAPAGLRTA